VEFGFIIPQDMNKTPFVIFASFGIYTHPPPPPTKTPGKVVDEVKAIMARLDEGN
jgi:hypothetical protein